MADAGDITITNRLPQSDTITILDQTPTMDMTKTERDVYPAGLRYDGRINYDHGQVLRFDGAGSYGGGWKYCNILQREGTVVDEIHGDIANPASYNSNLDTDSIAAQVTMLREEDRAVIRPLYNGLFKYQGYILHGNALPALIDPDMLLCVRKPFRYNGKKKYYTIPYEGLAQFDGSLSYGGGLTYKGDTISEEVV
jgi:hypothetical protein